MGNHGKYKDCKTRSAVSNILGSRLEVAAMKLRVLDAATAPLAVALVFAAKEAAAVDSGTRSRSLSLVAIAMAGMGTLSSTTGTAEDSMTTAAGIYSSAEAEMEGLSKVSPFPPRHKSTKVSNLRAAYSGSLSTWKDKKAVVTPNKMGVAMVGMETPTKTAAATADVLVAVAVVVVALAAEETPATLAAAALDAAVVLVLVETVATAVAGSALGIPSSRHAMMCAPKTAGTVSNTKPTVTAAFSSVASGSSRRSLAKDWTHSGSRLT